MINPKLRVCAIFLDAAGPQTQSVLVAVLVSTFPQSTA